MDNILITCGGKKIPVAFGTLLSDIVPLTGRSGAKPLAALVDHRLRDLSYRITGPHEVEFIDYLHSDGRRCYVRSLCFVLQKAVSELFPEDVLVIDHSLPSGLYCKLTCADGSLRTVSDADLEKIHSRMLDIVAADFPFVRSEMPVDEAAELFTSHRQIDKAGLFRSIGCFSVTVYTLDGYTDTFHGALVPSSGYLRVFNLTVFGEGFCLQPPVIGNPDRVMPMKRQSKIAASLKEYSQWCDVLGIKGIGSLNKAISEGRAVEIINLAEARQERKYAAIADRILEALDRIRIVMIAGPSSSGKTSSSLRLALQCRVLGMNPKVIELDNYFLNREDTPLDEFGNKDSESLYAMDLDFLNHQLNDLLAGREIEVPKFDFKEGRRVFTGKRLHLESNDILIMEGIHALNPDLTPSVDQSRIFRVYASALTSLNIDENNNISTTDNRLLRRMVRDNRVRGITPEDTILRWPSVRRGEERNIFPFQENADAAFNSALIFELPMLKYYAEPLLLRIPPASPAYSEAVRLLKFLDRIVPLSPSEIAAIPPTSIMREFIGGQTL